MVLNTFWTETSTWLTSFHSVLLHLHFIRRTVAHAWAAVHYKVCCNKWWENGSKWIKWHWWNRSYSFIKSFDNTEQDVKHNNWIHKVRTIHTHCEFVWTRGYMAACVRTHAGTGPHRCSHTGTWRWGWPPFWTCACCRSGPGDTQTRRSPSRWSSCKPVKSHRQQSQQHGQNALTTTLCTLFTHALLVATWHNVFDIKRGRRLTKQSVSRGPVQPPAHSLWQHSLGFLPKHRLLHWGAHTVFVTESKLRMY